MKRLTELIDDRRGAAALEFALVGLPFVVLLLGLVEFGRGLHIRTALDAAGDRAQRAIMIDPSIDSDTVKAEIYGSFFAGPPEQIAVTFATETVAGIDYRTVSLGFEMRLILPPPVGRNITIRSTRRVALPD